MVLNGFNACINHRIVLYMSSSLYVYANKCLVRKMMAWPGRSKSGKRGWKGVSDTVAHGAEYAAGRAMFPSHYGHLPDKKHLHTYIINRRAKQHVIGAEPTQLKPGRRLLFIQRPNSGI